MDDNISSKACELCKEQIAAVLCSDCYRCYCERCNIFIHDLPKFKSHKVEVIPRRVMVNARCSFHDDTPLEMFCVDEVILCCAMCEKEKFHEGYKFAKIINVKEDNEAFSAHKVRVLFEESIKRSEELDKRIEDVINKMENEVNDVREKVKKTFKEEHKKLEEEEKKFMDKLEEIKSKNVDPLLKYLENLSKVLGYSDDLNK